MKFLKSYTKDRAKEVVIVTDEGEFPIWIKDYERFYIDLERDDDIPDPDALRDLAVKREIKKSAIRKISAGNNTKNGLIRKILRERMFGTFPDRADVERIVEKLAVAGFINDAMYADRFLESALKKGWGEFKVRSAMRERGFESCDIDASLEKADPDWESIAKEWLEKNGEEDRDTAFRKLQSRGFKTDTILNVLNGD